MQIRGVQRKLLPAFSGFQVPIVRNNHYNNFIAGASWEAKNQESDPFHFKNEFSQNSLEVKCLGLCAFTAECMGSIPDPKIPQDMQHSQKLKSNKFYELVLGILGIDSVI